MNTPNGHLSLLRHMTTVADPIRCRMLAILAQELTVSELCTVLQLPQSTVSRHLKALQDDGWITSRRDGTSRFYSMAPEELAEDARGLWKLIEAQVAETPAAAQDAQRVNAVLASRRSKSREFFASTADQWDRVREELFGRTFHFQALLGLLDPTWTIGDLGCGSGLVTQALAPFVGKVVAVDGSAEMLETAAERLREMSNVDLRQGELEALPLPDSGLDAAVIALVLHYVSDPARVLGEVFRVLRPGGRLLLIDMLPHEHEEYQQQMGHVWLGFSPTQISRYLTHAGFENPHITPLHREAEARGPELFAATAVRSAEPAHGLTDLPLTTASTKEQP